MLNNTLLSCGGFSKVVYKCTNEVKADYFSPVLAAIAPSIGNIRCLEILWLVPGKCTKQAKISLIHTNTNLIFDLFTYYTPNLSFSSFI